MVQESLVYRVAQHGCKLLSCCWLIWYTMVYHTHWAETPLHKLLNKLSTNPKIVQSLINISGTLQLGWGWGGGVQCFSPSWTQYKNRHTYIRTHTQAHTLADGQLKEDLHLAYCRAEQISATKAVFQLLHLAHTYPFFSFLSSVPLMVTSALNMSRS